MDYTAQPLAFRVRKVLRYVRLYGLRRTRIKIASHYHMKRRYRELPLLLDRDPRGRHVGIIGCGKFAYAQIAYYLYKNYGKVIYAAMDTDIHRAASLSTHYGLAYYTDDASEVIEDPAVDTVFIASNHASHAEYAIEALDHAKTVHIEKPHIVNEDQLVRLCAAMRDSSSSVALGFNRPHSEIGRLVSQYLHSDSGPAILNWFVRGHEIPPDHWYHHPEEGGRVLGNLCHWIDFVYQMVPPRSRYPIKIFPSVTETRAPGLAVTFVFGDGTIAAVTFSAMGHAFEGIRERLTAHRGDTLIAMDDFQSLEIQVVDVTRRIRSRFRDHGHERMICESYELGRGARGAGCTLEYVWEAGELFLKTKEALEHSRPMTVDAFHPEKLAIMSRRVG